MALRQIGGGMDDERLGNRLDFQDLQRELSGAGGAKAERFMDGEHSPRDRDRKQRQKATERLLTELARLRLDPAYEAAHQAANDAINDAQAALDIALDANARLIADLEDRAVKLPDGRAVFIRTDGRGETADGEIIPAAIMLTLDIPNDAPTIDAYDAARERRRALGGYADEIDRARDEVNDPDNPASKERLEEIDTDMDTLIRNIEGVSSAKTAFEAATASSTEQRGQSLLVSLPKIGE